MGMGVSVPKNNLLVLLAAVMSARAKRRSLLPELSVEVADVFLQGRMSARFNPRPPPGHVLSLEKLQQVHLLKKAT
jgi:hypothetical protein